MEFRSRPSETDKQQLTVGGQVQPQAKTRYQKENRQYGYYYQKYEHGSIKYTYRQGIRLLLFFRSPGLPGTGAELPEKTGGAVRTTGDAKGAAVKNEKVRIVDPVFREYDLHQVALDLVRGFLPAEPEQPAYSSDIKIHR